MAEGALGVFLIGALGDVATTCIAGCAALARGLWPPTGLVTALPELAAGTELVPLGALRFGGLDVRAGELGENAARLEREGVLPAGLGAAVAESLAEASARVEPGILLGAAEPVRALALPALREQRLAPREALAYVRERLSAFRRAAGVERVVVVQLASAEPLHPEAAALAEDSELERFLDRADPRTPASLIYALAALEERCPYLNFTPALGASAPAVRARARRLGVAHAGRDGKTGETLLKSVLGPMFAARHLRVLSWAGYNILGNRDGQVLADPEARAGKLQSKRSVLAGVLGPGQPGSEHVTIEFVPSLGDWKTAWNHVHFEGFLGVRMALELTWRGSDSALAAPLVLDGVRLLERAARAGRAGVVHELACLFKDPLECGEHAFAAQWQMLLQLAARWRLGPSLGATPPPA
ncbi:MAG: hypothetical protein KatS3mg102_0810 [Planctomycetota bacterium]|nr:MAG: hypothetical protein KatS3mg102_0810 [Planctomycetota bacterium]